MGNDDFYLKFKHKRFDNENDILWYSILSWFWLFDYYDLRASGGLVLQVVVSVWFPHLDQVKVENLICVVENTT